MFRPAGFTLMETLVAIIILAMALTVVLQLFSGSLGAGKLAKDYTRAGFHASEQMENLLLTPTLEPGVVSGQWDDGYSWEANITAVEESPEAIILPVRPLKVALTVRWSDGPRIKTYDIETLTLSPKSEPLL